MESLGPITEEQPPVASTTTKEESKSTGSEQLPASGRTCASLGSTAKNYQIRWDKAAGTIEHPPQGRLKDLSLEDKMIYCVKANRSLDALFQFKPLLQKSLKSRMTRLNDDDTLYCLRFLFQETPESRVTRQENDEGLQTSAYSEFNLNMEAMMGKVENRIEDLEAQLTTMRKEILDIITMAQVRNEPL
ncbi:hypothetical protein Q9189_007215 [Teloschistes chrysophthalmus]